MRFSHLLPWFIVLGAAAPLQPLAAQTPPATIIRVRVADSASLALAGADVTVLRGTNQVVARGNTDQSGLRVFALADSGEYQLVVRKLGYQRVSQFFRTAGTEPMSFSVTLSRIPQTLPTVKVTAKETLRQRKLFIDADSIAASGVYLRDAMDIVRKLRSTMVWGMSGPPGNGAFPANMCDPVSDIWVNGERIMPELVLTDQNVLDRAKPTRVAPMAAHVLIVLSMIKPEHVEQMRRLDCMEPSPFTDRRLGAENAIFVVLKRGVAFNLDSGSYVAKDRATGKP